MLIDSHCHLNRIDLSQFENSFDTMIKAAAANGVEHFLSVCVDLEEYPALCAIADSYKNISISVGIHPDSEVRPEMTADRIIQLAKQHPSCIAIGETGLDYYRVETENGRLLQKNLFREHIRAAIAVNKPLIIHTRQAKGDTLSVLAEEEAEKIGGVMHCFSEDLETAERAMEMNFYISLSGIVTFKNAMALQELAKKIPLDRLLIETDAPYLAPVPFRGKQNHPALVKHVAQTLSELRGLSYEAIAKQTTENFKRCFRQECFAQ